MILSSSPVVSLPAGIVADADSMLPNGVTPHGGCYISTPAATTITTGGTFYLLAGTTTVGAGGTTLVTHASPGRLTYTGSVTRPFTVMGNISFISSANNILAKVRIAKNGATIAESESQFFKSTSTDTKDVPFFVVVNLAQNDYIEVYVTCDSNASTMTANAGNLFIQAQ